MTRIVKIDENIKEGTVRVSSHYWLQVFCGVNAAPFPKQSKKERALKKASFEVLELWCLNK